MGRIGCNIGDPDNDLHHGESLFGEQAQRDYSNRAPDKPLTPEALQAFTRAIADGERKAEPHTITISPQMYDAICAAAGVDSFTYEDLVRWALAWEGER